MTTAAELRSYLEVVVESEDASVRPANRLKAIELLIQLGALDAAECPWCAEYRGLSGEGLDAALVSYGISVDA